MIYSKFGTALALVSKYQELNGKVSIQATAGGTADVREYYVDDMKADGGLTEINEAIGKLPWKVIMGKKERRAQKVM
jgi:hypothetical protein